MGKQIIRYSDPACYIITVPGELSEEMLEILSNYFAGDFDCKYRNYVTRLEGLIKDQIALSGLLIYLCDLHYVLLSVKIKEVTEIKKQKIT